MPAQTDWRRRLFGLRPVRHDEAYYGTAEWKRLRAEHLEIEPWCRRCLAEGQGLVAADQVNHMLARKRGGKSEHGNLESLCRRHHSIETFSGR